MIQTKPSLQLEVSGRYVAGQILLEGSRAALTVLADVMLSNAPSMVRLTRLTDDAAPYSGFANTLEIVPHESAVVIGRDESRVVLRGNCGALRKMAAGLVNLARSSGEGTVMCHVHFDADTCDYISPQSDELIVGVSTDP